MHPLGGLWDLLGTCTWGPFSGAPLLPPWTQESENPRLKFSLKFPELLRVGVGMSPMWGFVFVCFRFVFVFAMSIKTTTATGRTQFIYYFHLGKKKPQLPSRGRLCVSTAAGHGPVQAPQGPGPCRLRHGHSGGLTQQTQGPLPAGGCHTQDMLPVWGAGWAGRGRPGSTLWWLQGLPLLLCCWLPKGLLPTELATGLCPVTPWLSQQGPLVLPRVWDGEGARRESSPLRLAAMRAGVGRRGQARVLLHTGMR